MFGCVALIFTELLDVFGHQGALAIVIKPALTRIVGERVQLAAERLLLAQNTPCVAQMRAFCFNANALALLFF